jgi:hypothetical protein
MPRTVAQHGVGPDIAPTGAHLTYYGGRVLSNTQVVQVIWGTGSYESHVTSTGSPSVGSFYQQVLNSAYVDWLSEYNTNVTGGTHQTIGRGSFVAQITITPSFTGSTISDAQVQTELQSQILAGHLPPPNANTYYAIFFPHGKTITQGGSNSCQSGGFCAYHGTVAGSPSNWTYGVHPDMQAGSGCDTGCGSAGTVFGNITSVASHELIETITDPDVGLALTNAPPLAWYDNTNGEIGDICNAQQGTFIGSDGVVYTVQKEFSNVLNNCIVTNPSVVVPDFAMAVSPPNLTYGVNVRGLTDTVSTATLAGPAEALTLSVTGAPAGMRVVLNPLTLTSGSSASLTLSRTAAIASGVYPLVVKAVGTSLTHTATLTVTVP